MFVLLSGMLHELDHRLFHDGDKPLGLVSQVDVLQNEECISLMRTFIGENPNCGTRTSECNNLELLG